MDYSEKSNEELYELLCDRYTKLTFQPVDDHNRLTAIAFLIFFDTVIQYEKDMSELDPAMDYEQMSNKELRQYLKKRFPGVKFRISSDEYRAMVIRVLKTVDRQLNNATQEEEMT
jgi:hypothetical protein